MLAQIHSRLSLQVNSYNSCDLKSLCVQIPETPNWRAKQNLNFCNSWMIAGCTGKRRWKPVRVFPYLQFHFKLTAKRSRMLFARLNKSAPDDRNAAGSALCRMASRATAFSRSNMESEAQWRLKMPQTRRNKYSMVEPEIWNCLVSHLTCVELQTRKHSESLWLRVRLLLVGPSALDELQHLQSLCQWFPQCDTAYFSELCTACDTCALQEALGMFCQVLSWHARCTRLGGLKSWLHSECAGHQNRFNDAFPTPSSSELCQSFPYFFHLVHLYVLALDATKH